MEVFAIMVLLTLLAIITLAIIRQRSMYCVVMLSSIYSFLIATVMLVLDAVDVAMTEASVGAGISTVLFFATLYLTKTQEYPPVRNVALPLFVSGVVGAALIYGTFDLPQFGQADTPVHNHVAPKYLADAIAHKMPPNVVTGVLADYRSFDTLGETTVIFTAGIGVLLLLRSRRRKIGSVNADGTLGDDGDGFDGDGLVDDDPRDVTSRSTGPLA